MKSRVLLFISFCLLVNIINAYDFQYRPVHILKNSMELIEDNIENFAIHNIHDIYPIGWSEDGKFAYIQHKHWDESMSQSYKLVIQSMVTDSIIWENNFFNLFRLVEDANYQKYEELQKIYYDILTPEFYYQYKKDEINEVLAKYNIVQIAPTSIEKLPISSENGNINILLNELKRDDSHEDRKGMFFYDSYLYNIEVINNNNEKKVIHTNHLQGEEVMGSQIVGFLKSPFEERIAVFVAYFHWDRHLTHYVRFGVVGCETNYGFQ